MFRVLFYFTLFLCACAKPILAAPPNMMAPAATPTSAPNGTDRVAIETIIHDYLLAHPEVLPLAMQVLQERQQAEAVNTHRAAIETPWGNAWEGDANGDVTLVEFFDYNCGYCRASIKDVARLLSEDKHLHVVYREIPVLGADSDAAALTSLAVAQSPADWPRFQRAIFAAGDASGASLVKAAHNVGIILPSEAVVGKKALRDQINQNLALVQDLHISGTPSWVIGNHLLSGAVGYDALKAAIADVRANKVGTASVASAVSAR